MSELDRPVIVEFPLRGEWAVPNTPGNGVPSHGTDRLGTRYAYDFLQVDWDRRGTPCYSVSFLRYLLRGVSVRDCYCYGKEIYAPCDGVVVAVEDHYPERERAKLGPDVRRAGKNSRIIPEQENVKKVTGNYIILKHQEGVYAAFCHLRPRSAQVRVGQTVKTGMCLGKIGHTGNSYFPHLHFQLMDSADLDTARGLPCGFRFYEVYRNGTWEPVRNGIPKASERIRFPEEGSQPQRT